MFGFYIFNALKIHIKLKFSLIMREDTFLTKQFLTCMLVAKLGYIIQNHIVHERQSFFHGQKKNLFDIFTFDHHTQN